MSKVETIALIQRLRQRANSSGDDRLTEDFRAAAQAIEESQQWFGNFNVFKYPWWAKTYWLAVFFISSGIYVDFGKSAALFMAAGGSLLAIIAYGLYKWVRWCNSWDR